MKIPYWTLAVAPSLLFGIGFAMNAIVMGINGSQMPVQLSGCTVDVIGEGTVGAIHSCMTAATHLKVLADWIVVRGVGIASPGDFLEWASDYVQPYFYTAFLTLLLNDLGLFKDPE
jgi:hypothetical protein